MGKVKLGRYNLSELSTNRLMSAVNTRMQELPHTVAWHTSPFSRENKRRIREFRDIHLGKRCFIVANGPSIKKTNLDLIANEITFGLNRIYLNFENTSFRPTYYVAVNELVLEQFSEDISQLKMPRFINWNRRSFFDIQSPTITFLKSKMVIRDSFQTDLTRPLVVGGTVTFVALQLAYYMGFQKVIVVGLDHDYAEKGNPNRVEIRNMEKDESHFSPNYFPKGTKWQLPDLARSEIDYQIALNEFEKAGREIIDATIGGKCQVFRKAEFSSLFV